MSQVRSGYEAEYGAGCSELSAYGYWNPLMSWQEVEDQLIKQSVLHQNNKYFELDEFLLANAEGIDLYK